MSASFNTAPTDSAVLLEGRSLACERGGRVLFTELSFQVCEGELWRVAGPNGVGKTSLLRLVTGLSAPAAGELYWRGASYAAQRWQRLGEMLYLGHRNGVKAKLTPRENLAFWYPNKNQAIEQALQYWGLQTLADQYCHRLSAGQQQRVALCRLLLSQHLFWVLDEPFTAIDQEGVAQLERLLLDHAKRGGAVVMTTHHSFADTRMKILALEGCASAPVSLSEPCEQDML